MATKVDNGLNFKCNSLDLIPIRVQLRNDSVIMKLTSSQHLMTAHAPRATKCQQTFNSVPDTPPLFSLNSPMSQIAQNPKGDNYVNFYAHRSLKIAHHPRYYDCLAIINVLHCRITAEYLCSHTIPETTQVIQNRAETTDDVRGVDALQTLSRTTSSKTQRRGAMYRHNTYITHTLLLN